MTDFFLLISATDAEYVELRDGQREHIQEAKRFIEHGAPPDPRPRRAGEPLDCGQEMAHSSTDMIERTYGHLGTIRHRARVVEYQVRQHRKVLRGRLELVA